MPQFENTDGRRPGHWLTRYPEPRAKWWIIGEGSYLGLLMFAMPSLMLVLWLGSMREPLGLSEDRYAAFCRYCYAWLGGTFGGAMFSIKWLYHSVARHYWNEDRRLWRFFCPHLSGGLAFTFLATATSGLFNTMNVTAFQRPSAIVACAFLVGYFSDSAIGKFREVADTLFGNRRDRDGGSSPADSTSASEPANPPTAATVSTLTKPDGPTSGDRTH